MHNHKLRQTLLSLSILFVVINLIISIIWAQIDPAPRYKPLTQIQRFDANNAFWTTWSNWIVLIFLVFLLINGKGKLWKPGDKSWIIMCSYMTMTMILFWIGIAGLFSAKDETNVIKIFGNDYSSAMKWYITIYLHGISTIMIFTMFFLRPIHRRIDKKTWLTKDIFFYLAIPVAYILFVALRAVIINNTDNYYKNATTNEVDVVSVPYFFFDYKLPNGQVTFLFGAGTVFGAAISILFLWTFINNKLSKKHNIKEKIVFKEHGSLKLYKNKNIEFYISESIKLALYVIATIFSVIKLTDKDKFINDNYFVFNIVYFLSFLFIIILSILGITTSLLYIFKLNTYLNYSKLIYVLFWCWSMVLLYLLPFTASLLILDICFSRIGKKI